MAGKIVVTRHPALIALLKERGLADGAEAVLSHASPDEIRGKDVIGVLPLNLACMANSVTEIPLRLTQELRERGELDLETLREIAGEARKYKVTEIK